MHNHATRCTRWRCWRLYPLCWKPWEKEPTASDSLTISYPLITSDREHLLHNPTGQFTTKLNHCAQRPYGVTASNLGRIQGISPRPLLAVPPDHRDKRRGYKVRQTLYCAHLCTDDKSVTYGILEKKNFFFQFQISFRKAL